MNNRKHARLTGRQCRSANLRRNFPIILLLIPTLLSLTSCKSKTEEPSNRLVRTSTFEGVIFTQQHAEILNRTLGDSRITGYWTPGQADVISLEAGLFNYLQSVANLFPQGPPTEEQLLEYHRQYLGIIEEGRHVIYANYFCEDSVQDWENQFVMVQDGGSCFFQLRFEVGASRYYDLHINGEA